MSAKLYLCSTNLEEMLETILISVLIVAICIALLALQIIVKKNGKFPNTHVSGNPAMRKRSVHCVQSQDREARLNRPGIRESLHTSASSNE